MSKQVRFTKYEGLGNDFVLIDRIGGGGPLVDGDLARALCDRRRGVGADGVLILDHADPGLDGRPAWRMQVFNADGSVSEMCGNGLRCVARHLATEHGFLGGPVQTGAGVLRVELVPDGVSVAMGAARSLGRLTLEAAGQQVEGHHVRLGNPHFVLFGRWSDAVFERLGPALATHPQFPEGVNVSFATPTGPARIELKVWERGAGPTLACGTGACATVAASWWEQRLSAAPVQVRLPGGVLSIDGAPTGLVMRGPARRVFEGVWPH